MDDESQKHSRRAFLAASATLVAATGVSVAESRADQTVAGVGVTTIADALNRLGYDAMALSMSTSVKPLTSTTGTVIGPAVTTEWRADGQRMTGEDVRRFMFEPLDDADPGSVWVVAGGTDRMLSLFGGVIGVACKRNGVLAAVTDNACRDIEEFERAGFPVFAKAAVPFGPGSFARPVAANEPVVCDGVEVSPGDYVAADRDGVIVVPASAVTEVMAKADEVLAGEQAILEKIEQGEPLAEAYKI